MKKRNLFSMALLSTLAVSCSQEEIVAPNNSANNGANDFSKYQGVPFNGEIGFSRGETADSRMGLDPSGKYTFKDGDRVGLVWVNAPEINTALNSYDGSKETDAVKSIITALGYSDINDYTNAVKTGKETPVDGSYVWTSYPAAHRVFSNTRMTYEERNGKPIWHMTDGQIFKGYYFAYSPYNEKLQAASKFRVAQSADQKQKKTVGKLEETASHILDDKTGMVWISQNIPAATSDAKQNISFLYPLVEDGQTGTAKDVNIQMRPFSNILDTRINIENTDGAMADADVKAIKVLSVDLVADNEVFPTMAAFDLSKWGSTNIFYGVYGEKYDRSDPKVYTWKADKTFKGYYTPENLTDKVTTTIAEASENNGNEQRVQLMLLPQLKDDKTDAIKTEGATTYKVIVNTDYGYIEIPELLSDNEKYSLYRQKSASEGVVVNPVPGTNNLCYIDNSDESAEYRLNYVLSKVGARATRAIKFNASDLEFNNINISNMDDLVNAITKWNKLGKSGPLNLVAMPGCNLSNLVWDNSGEAVSMKTYNMYVAGQPADGDITFSKANEEIKKFLDNGLNKLKITGNLTLSGKTAINADRLSFANNLTVDKNAILAITGASQTMYIATTLEGSEIYVANNDKAHLTLKYNNAVIKGTATVYAKGAMTVSRNTSITGILNINGNFDITSGKTVTNNGTVNLFALANVAMDKYAIANNAVINYVDTPAKFANKSIKNSGIIVAEITSENEGNHKGDYIQKASDFGVTNLIVNAPNTFNYEWNTNSTTLGFKNVEFSNVSIDLFKDLNMPNATVTVKQNVAIIGNSTGNVPVFTVNKIVLGANSNLEVKGVDVNEKNLTEMHENSILRGYDKFFKKEYQPEFLGSGSHMVYDSNEKPMTFNK